MPTSSRKIAIGVFLLSPSISLALATLNEDRAKCNRSLESCTLKNRAGNFFFRCEELIIPTKEKF